MTLLTSIYGYDTGYWRRILCVGGGILIRFWSLSKVSIEDFLISISKGNRIYWEVVWGEEFEAWLVLNWQKELDI